MYGRLYRRNHPGGGDVPERSPVVVEDGTERIIRSRTAPKEKADHNGLPSLLAAAVSVKAFPIREYCTGR